jgi:hypothetical protein
VCAEILFYVLVFPPYFIYVFCHFFPHTVSLFQFKFMKFFFMFCFPCFIFVFLHCHFDFEFSTSYFFFSLSSIMFFLCFFISFLYPLYDFQHSYWSSRLSVDPRAGLLYDGGLQCVHSHHAELRMRWLTDQMFTLPLLSQSRHSMQDSLGTKLRELRCFR